RSTFAAADGSLPSATFDRWLTEDYFFVLSFRAFLQALHEIAPDDNARDVLAGGLAALAPELAMFEREAAARIGSRATWQNGCLTTLSVRSRRTLAPAVAVRVAVACQPPGA